MKIAIGITEAHREGVANEHGIKNTSSYSFFNFRI